MREGNIGGILSRTTAAGPAFYGYNDKGNVTLLTDSAGQDVGHYRYDAFGVTLEAAGPRAGENPYRFSTKPVHERSGLVDFRLRPVPRRQSTNATKLNYEWFASSFGDGRRNTDSRNRTYISGLEGRGSIH